MKNIWEKLNLKSENKIAVLNAPESFIASYQALTDVEVFTIVDSCAEINFYLIFVLSQEAIEQYTTELIVNLLGDNKVWFAYPKGSSKRYSCDVNRDIGWEPLKEAGYRGVRQIAIDEDWSALRFRKNEYVKSAK